MNEHEAAAPAGRNGVRPAAQHVVRTLVDASVAHGVRADALIPAVPLVYYAVWLADLLSTAEV